jgi:outer membrane protein OmpA-like peptidoglycan-associated protein
MEVFMSAKALVYATIFALSAPAAAYAGSAQVEDIVQFYANAAKASQSGATRGICVGTEAECGAVQPKPAFRDLFVTFEKNSDRLTTDARDKLQDYTAALKDPRLAKLNFAVDGYTDASGPNSFNLTLSERRAHSVAKFLSGQGVEASRLDSKGYGEENFRTSDPYDPSNRRVELRLIVE